MMSEDKRPLVPHLRFPEFRDAGVWEEKRLGDVYSFKITNSFSRDKLNYDHGDVKNIHYGDIHTKFSALFDIEKENVPFINPDQPIERINEENYCVEGDLVIADASEDMDDVGKCIELVKLNGERVLSGLHTILARQIHSEIIVGFGAYLFASPSIRRNVKKEAQGAKVLGISGGRLSGIDIFFPKEKPEQRKIADCLSSLDDLIGARVQKLEALKAHKKGLMQQLFPAPGQTTPALRFPEFQDAGPWEEKRLGDTCQMNAGEFVRASNIKEKVEEDLFPCYGGNGLRGFTKTFTHDGTFSLIGRQGALCGNITSATGKFHATEHAIVTNPKENTITSWLFYQLIHLNLNQYATGQAQPGLSVTNLTEIPITIPKDKGEQQEIADCLTSVDDLIRAEGQKLDALGRHKKGLMQQLFPTSAKVGG